jgi:actin-related protein 6
LKVGFVFESRFPVSNGFLAVVTAAEVCNMVVCIIDNGAGKIKAGVCKHPNSIDDLLQVKHTNCTARVIKQMNILVADEVDNCFNGSLLQYNRPFDRGYLVNWQCETEVWSRLFGSGGLNIKPSESSLCVTDAPFTPEILQNDMNEVVFEEYNFLEYLRKPSAWFSAYQFALNHPENTQNATCCAVIDSGFSFTHTMPFLNGKCQKSAVRL